MAAIAIQRRPIGATYRRARTSAAGGAVEGLSKFTRPASRQEASDGRGSRRWFRRQIEEDPMVESSTLQKAARVVGIVFLLVGILGFIPGITSNYGDMKFAGNTSDAE